MPRSPRCPSSGCSSRAWSTPSRPTPVSRRSGCWKPRAARSSSRPRRPAAASRPSAPVSRRRRPASPATSSRCSSPTTRSSRRPDRARRWSTTGTRGCSTGRGANGPAPVAARTYELSQYLVDVLGPTDLGARVDAAGHRPRRLPRPPQPRGAATRRAALLGAAGAEIVEMGEARDVLRVRGHLLRDARRDRRRRWPTPSSGSHAATGAEWLVSVRPGLPAAPRRPAAPDRPERPAARSTSPTCSPPAWRADARRRARPRCRTGWSLRAHDPRPSAAVARSPTRTCSARCATSTSGSAPPREVEAETSRAEGPCRRDPARGAGRTSNRCSTSSQAALEAHGVTVHRCATPEDARRVVLDLARREGVSARREVEVDGDRGDRPRRHARSERASRRSRPTSASTSCSSPVSARRTSSRP